MSEPPRPDLPDQLPPSAASDPPLSLERRTPGARGLGSKLGLAALGLMILLAVMAALWAATHESPRGKLQRPPVEIEQR